jgi:tetratricopeptide (TPR) repeat protein
MAAPERLRAMAERARRRAEAEHRWATRWPELLACLDDTERALSPPSPSLSEPASAPAPSASDMLEHTLLGLGLDAEREGRHALAAELYGELLLWSPAEPTALAGLGRARLALGDAGAAAEMFTAALEASRDLVAGPALYLTLPSPGAPPGLGRAAFLRPEWELRAYRLAALLASNQSAEALAAVAALGTGDEVVTVGALLDDDGVPAHAPVWRALFAAALAAQPVQQTDAWQRHRDRWAAALARLP